jgi:hypothetical protein
MPDDGAPNAPEEGPPEEGPENHEQEPETGALRSWFAENRTLALGLGSLGLCGIIALDLYFMTRSSSEPGAPSLAVKASEPPAAKIAAAPAPSVSSAPAAAPSADSSAPGLDFESDDGEPRSKKPPPPKHYATVQQAAIESCTTASVDGLSRQIIEQARCIRPNAFVPLPSRPNLVVLPQVFPYLESKARNQLLKALDAHPKTQMTINSALRTVAQQYLVWRWSATKRCGVPLATPPGESNHEVGTALDIAEAASWRSALEAREFKWLGASDRVHFDFKGGNAPPRSATDVLAFQKLWNRNHPTDKLSEDGRYTPTTEQRLKQAPPDGFAIGPSCGGRRGTVR